MTSYRTAERVSPGRRRVLIVESHPAILRILQESLENAGYEARITMSAPHALRYARRFQPDAIVLGVDGPIGPVRNLLTNLREGAGLEHAPCVVLCHGAALPGNSTALPTTSAIEFTELQASLRDSCTAVLSSPFSPRHLLAKLAPATAAADAS